MTATDPIWQVAFEDIKQAMPNRELTLNDEGDGSLLRQLYVPILLIPFGIIFFFKMLYDLIIDHSDIKVIITLVIAAILIIVGLSTVFSVFDKIKIKRIINDPINQPWQITTMKVVCLQEEFMFNTFIKDKEKVLSTEYKLHEPIVLSHIKDDDHWVLAIQAKDTKTVWPMSRRLNNINLNDNERASLRAAIERHFSL